jgi:UDP-N-acetylglucosamine--N-acetylmuramyl-(pentapeptide) pyrophosphoryl-undecaprenol N-acetylglucosamine transferase
MTQGMTGAQANGRGPGGHCVLIMAGGTGGHIFPGLAVAESLRRRGVEVRWLGARGGMECAQVPPRGIALDVVDISGLRGKGVGRWLAAPWQLLRAVLQASRLLGALRPSCAISFGGYAAGPGGLAAKLRGIPLLVHEQNRIPGMTNRVLARFAARVLQAFPGTWDEGRQAVICGNPVRQDVAGLDEPATRLAGRSGPLRLLVTGGSQGARALNRLVPEALALLPAGLAVVVRHQCGRGRQDETRAAYEVVGVAVEPTVGAASAATAAVGNGEEFAAKAAPTAKSAPTGHIAEISEFIDDIAESYAWADLVVCRAGALTVSEVAAAGLPAVFVPFPHAVDDHQTRNAEFLVEHRAAVLMSETTGSAQQLADILADLLRDRGKRLDMAVRARAAAVPDSAERVAALCLEYAAA